MTRQTGCCSAQGVQSAAPSRKEEHCAMLSHASTRARVCVGHALHRGLQTASWSVPTAAGGKLKVRLPTVCAVRVGVLDPVVDGWDQARVSLRAESGVSRGEAEQHELSTTEAAKVTNALDLKVAADYEPGKNFLLVESCRESTPTSLARLVHLSRQWLGGPFRSIRSEFDATAVVDIRIPGKFDVDIELMDGTVTLEDTIEGDVRVTSTRADVSINRLKSMYIDIETGDGDVSAIMLQGNVTVRSQAGMIDVGKAQGPSIQLSSRDGDIQAGSIYGDRATVRSGSGGVHLRGAQGCTKIRTIDGHVEVGAVEGRLEVETDAGDVEAQLSVPRTVSIRTRTGDVAVSVPDGVPARVCLQAASRVDVEESLKVQNVNASVAPAGSHDVSEAAEASQSEPQGISRQLTTSVRGWIGLDEKAPTVPRDESPATIYARALNGELTVTKETWSGIGNNSMFPEKAGRYPRWAPPIVPSGETARA